MIPRPLLRKLPFYSRFSCAPRRLQSSSTSTSPPTSTSPSATSKTRTRANKILDRVPRSLRPYTDRLHDAPLAHVVSFLILHELTAVVPLVGLAGVFHWGGVLPPLFSESSYLKPGIDKFGGYFRRKGWFGLGEEEGPGPVDVAGAGVEGGEEVQNWNLDTPGMRIVVEVAAAYAVTKALLPLRLMLSVWATPWFARVIVGRVWGGVVGLGRAGRGAGTGTVVAAGGLERSAAATGSGAMGKASKRIGRDIPKT